LRNCFDKLGGSNKNNAVVTPHVVVSALTQSILPRSHATGVQ